MSLRDTPLDQLPRLKVNLKWLTLSDRLHRGSFSRASTWQKFYNNQIVSPKEKFQYPYIKKKWTYPLSEGREDLELDLGMFW